MGFFSRAKPHGLPDPLRDDDLKLWRNGHCFHGSSGMSIDAQIMSYFCRTRVVATDSTPPQAGPPPQSLQIAMESLIPGGSGIGPERALERPHPAPPSRDSAKAPPVPTFPASTGPIPRSPHPRLSLTATQPPSPDPQHNRHPKTSTHQQSVNPSVRSQKTSR